MVKPMDAGRLPVERELRDVTEVIKRTAAEVAELANGDALNSSIICATDFLRTTLGRRSIILHELRKSGLSEQEAMRRIQEVRHADA